MSKNIRMMENNTMRYKDAMEEVEQILSRLEQGRLDVDEMAAHVKRAVDLLQACRVRLTEADVAVKKIFEDLQTN